MPLPILQCTTCQFKYSLKLKDFVFVCSQYQDGIPEFVGDGTKNCPEYKNEDDKNTGENNAEYL